MAIQFFALKPLNSFPLHVQSKNSPSRRRGTQLSVMAAESIPVVSVPWEEQIPPNAVRLKRDPSWRGGFSLGVDLGLSRTGIAISKGFTVWPLTVVELRGEKLELKLLDLAEKQEVDEFIIGLPKNSEGKETEQSNKGRSVAGRFAVRAAESAGVGEYMDHMIAKLETILSLEDYNICITIIYALHCRGLSREGKLDAYAAMKVLERYFSHSGTSIELVVPKQVELQNKLRIGPPKDTDFYSEE